MNIKFPLTPLLHKKKKRERERERKWLWCYLLRFPAKRFGFCENLGGFIGIYHMYNHQLRQTSRLNVTETSFPGLWSSYHSDPAATQWVLPNASSSCGQRQSWQSWGNYHVNL